LIFLVFCPITCMFVKTSADGYTSFIMCAANGVVGAGMSEAM
jgi:hypothetical protein